MKCMRCEHWLADNSWFGQNNRDMALEKVANINHIIGFQLSVGNNGFIRFYCIDNDS
jgi:hypothetical protein